MSEQPFRLGAAVARRKEKVPLSGGYLWVWEMTAAETLTMARNAERHPQDPRGAGVDVTESLVWQILLSCYDGDAEDAARVFADHQAAEVYRLPQRDYRAILEAIARLNGTDSEAEAAMQRFTPVSAGGSNSH